VNAPSPERCIDAAVLERLVAAWDTFEEVGMEGYVGERMVEAGRELDAAMDAFRDAVADRAQREADTSDEADAA
jgi:hypothetical protein